MTSITYEAQKRRRTVRFRRHESVNLVSEYVSCMDEICQIHESSLQKIEFLGKLREHCETLEKSYYDEATYRQVLERGELLTERIDEAVSHIRKNSENFPSLINDLKSSLNVVSMADYTYDLPVDRPVYSSFNYGRLNRMNLPSSPNRTIKPSLSSRS